MSTKLVRCRTCGFITPASSLGKTCPACGVPNKAFEEFESGVDESRRRWLALHAHSIFVHLPQAISMLLLPAIVIGMLAPDLPVLSGRIIAFAELAGILLPFAAAGGLTSGLIDGKIRFKKLSPRYLRIKTIAGMAFFAVTVIIAVIAFTAGIESDTFGIMAFLSLVALVLSILLGKIGGMLLCSVMKG